MKGNNKIFLLLFVFVLVFSLVACGDKSSDVGDTNGGDVGKEAEARIDTVMKIAHVSSPQDIRQSVAESVKDIVEGNTNGQVSVQIYPSSQLGGNDDLIQGMQNGTIEMVLLPAASLGGFQPLVSLIDIPFMLPQDEGALMKLYETNAMKDLFSTTEEKGFKILGVWHLGYNVFTANRPLTRPGDYKGLKFRAQNSPIAMGTINELGGTPVNLPFAEVYSAMQSKTVDGQGENDIGTVYNMKFSEVQTDFTLTNHGANELLVMVSKQWYDKLPKEIQGTIFDAVQEGSRIILEKAEVARNEVIKKVKDQGVKFHELTAEETEALKEATKGVEDIYIKLNGDRGKQLLEKVKEAKKSL